MNGQFFQHPSYKEQQIETIKDLDGIKCHYTSLVIPSKNFFDFLDILYGEQAKKIMGVTCENNVINVYFKNENENETQEIKDIEQKDVSKSDIEKG